MDTISFARREHHLADGRELLLRYEMLRELLLSHDGTPVCENYGVAVCQCLGGQKSEFRMENVTTDSGLICRLLQRLSDGAVTAETACDVLQDLMTESYLYS